MKQSAVLKPALVAACCMAVLSGCKRDPAAAAPEGNQPTGGDTYSTNIRTRDRAVNQVNSANEVREKQIKEADEFQRPATQTPAGGGVSNP